MHTFAEDMLLRIIIQPAIGAAGGVIVSNSLLSLRFFYVPSMVCPFQDDTLGVRNFRYTAFTAVCSFKRPCDRVAAPIRGERSRQWVGFVNIFARYPSLAVYTWLRRRDADSILCFGLRGVLPRRFPSTMC